MYGSNQKTRSKKPSIEINFDGISMDGRKFKDWSEEEQESFFEGFTTNHFTNSYHSSNNKSSSNRTSSASSKESNKSNYINSSNSKSKNGTNSKSSGSSSESGKEKNTEKTPIVNSIKQKGAESLIGKNYNQFWYNIAKIHTAMTQQGCLI